MKKKFDCVEMKRQVQEKVYEETKDLTREAELDYFHDAARQFWQEIEARRSNVTGTKSPEFQSPGITPDKAAEIRASFGTIAEDWDRPEMDAYDAL